jgi:very-short-patch-repair endonuclease/DNA polymerase III delta prime subunit
MSLADLPHHGCISVGNAPLASVEDDGEDDRDEHVLRVSRPPLPPIPVPPAEIASWLRDGWQNYEGSVSVEESKSRPLDDGTVELEHFATVPGRVRALTDWAAQRDAFLVEHMAALRTFRIFERLYELRGILEREAERYDVVLGDGILCWNVESGSIRFPIVLQRLELEFDPKIPSFTLLNAAKPTEFYAALFRKIESLDGAITGTIKNELEDGQYHPLSRESLTAFLKSIPPRLGAKGSFEEEAPTRETADPVIYRAPMVFLRKRTLGLGEALDRAVDAIALDDELPRSLLNIVGTGSLAAEPNLESSSGSEVSDSLQTVLFTKPANEEQYRIADALAQHACVLVQGPPGTGKTHTIANLLGHLLAEGKSVLVTSSTTKALRVLREKVVEKLQPLCVSVLDSDTQSNDQMKSAVDGIVERLSSSTEPMLSARVDRLTKERSELLRGLAETRRRLLQSRERDTQEIKIGVEAFDVLDAARLVARGRGEHSWIPLPVRDRAALGLTAEDLRALYRTNSSVPPSIERELGEMLPSPDALPTPGVFTNIVDEVRAIERLGGTGQLYWSQTDLEVSSESSVQGLMSSLEDLLAPWLASEPWHFVVANDAFRGGGHIEAWESLFTLVSELEVLCGESREPLLRYGPILADGVSLDEQLACLDSIHTHMSAGGSLGFFTRLLNPNWKPLLERMKVNGRSPQSKDEIDAVLLLAQIERDRRQLKIRWERQVVEIGGPRLFDARPEEAAAGFVRVIQSLQSWQRVHLEPFRVGLIAQGFDWNRAMRDSTIVGEEQSDFRAQIRLCKEIVPAALDARLKQFRIRLHDEFLANTEAWLSKYTGETSARLSAAVQARSVDAYSVAYKTLRALYDSMEALRIRRELLAKLSHVAPAWAESISRRLSGHDGDEPPGEPRSAWLWAQAAQQLEERDKISVSSLESAVARQVAQLTEKTAELADARAWLAQRKRTGLAQQQALAGWQQTVRRIGKGTGKRAPVLRKHARELMDTAKTAVPVWIMPIVRVAENYDPRTTRFDVVIVDEASQSDLTGLLALYYGRQVVVVGDDEQVSPEAVGQRIDETQHLIDSYLYGIPNDKLYDGKSSIYDLAKQAFGGTICLREHFRCVPDIIQFSNTLSYDDKLIPLREASESALFPHVVAHRVTGSSDNKVNDEEAEEIVALILSCLEQPEYSGKTFGVISLVGEEQALQIEKRLRDRVEPKVLEERRILCGNSAQFQGDERDVIFLSMVDSSNGTPLRVRDDAMFKKRFNVAASRARDQMWVVYSVDTGDLKSNDLRRKLIEHALNPQALTAKVEAAFSKAESVFEKDVLRRLITAGYRVQPQYRIGPYRIDIMVGDRSKRLAVECDGDQYHTFAELEQDMDRQSQLERAGLTFHRIRGSAYYRNADAEFGTLVRHLSDLGVEPGSTVIPRAATTQLHSRVVTRAKELRGLEPLFRADLASVQQPRASDPGVTNTPPLAYVSPDASSRTTDRAIGYETIVAADEAPHQASLFKGLALDKAASVPARPHENTGHDVLSLLSREGIEPDRIIDKREQRGVLWVVCDGSQLETFAALAAHGYHFFFAPEGGRATGHRPAWWLRTPGGN